MALKSVIDVLVLGLAGIVDMASQSVAELVQGGVIDDRGICRSRRPSRTGFSWLGGGLDLGVEGRASAGHTPAVDRQGRTGDPAGLAAGEEEDRLDDVAGLAVAAERVEVVDRVQDLLGLVGREEALVRGRLDERERDRVDADALGRELEREVLRRARGARPGRRSQALVGVVAIASMAHIEPTLTIAPPSPWSRIAAAAAWETQ